MSREIREELSLRVKIKQLLLVKRTQFNHLDMAYLCLADGEIGKISYELLDYRWCKRDNLPRLHTFHAQAVEKAFTDLEKE